MRPIGKRGRIYAAVFNRVAARIYRKRFLILELDFPLSVIEEHAVPRDHSALYQVVSHKGNRKAYRERRQVIDKFPLAGVFLETSAPRCLKAYAEHLVRREKLKSTLPELYGSIQKRKLHLKDLCPDAPELVRIIPQGHKELRGAGVRGLEYILQSFLYGLLFNRVRALREVRRGIIAQAPHESYALGIRTSSEDPYHLLV